MSIRHPLRALPWPAAAAVVVAMIVAVLPAQAQTGAFPPDTVAVGLDDPSTSAVALELSQATFADDAVTTVAIGRDDLFADSLASGVVQAVGPLLLVPTAGPVPQAVMAEIDRLGATRAVILGGENAVAPAVAVQLAAADLTVERREGPSRTETAIAVARTQAPTATTAILARSGGVEGNPTSAFADALAAGGWAAATGWPVLLTQTDVLTESTRVYLQQSLIRTVHLMGGTAAIDEAVAGELAALGLTVLRVSGTDRADTAVETARARGAQTAGDVTQVILVDGFGEDAWASGFAAAARSAALDAPIVLGNVDSVPPATLEWLVPGPMAITCAVSAVVCEESRLALGFDPGLPITDMPAGSVLFSISDGSTSRVMSVQPDGSGLGTVFTCEASGCEELDWEAGSRTLLLHDTDVGLVALDGESLEARTLFARTDRVTPLTFDTVDVVMDDPRYVSHWSVDGDATHRGVSRLSGAGGSTVVGTPVPARPASFQSMSSSPAVSDCLPATLHIRSDQTVHIAGCPPGEDAQFGDVLAHVQGRPGAMVLGAALLPDGSGDIAITDVVGGTGALRIAPAQGDALVVGGLDVTSTPLWLPDGATVAVLARIDGQTALVAVDAETGAIEVLVSGAGTGAGDHRISADRSGTSIAWHTGEEVRVLDTRDGSVTAVAVPAGYAVTGGPAIRP